MAENKQTCPSCGSALAINATLCDICGEDLTAPPVAPRRNAPEKAAVSPKAPAAPAKPAKNTRGKAKQSKDSTALFSTRQWVAICVASMVLGGVLTASFLPTTAGDETGTESQAPTASTDQPQLNLERLNQLRSYIEEHPEDLEARLRYANDLHDSNLPDQAIVQYKLYLEEKPDNPDARVDLGICYFELQQYAEAIKEMEAAVAVQPDHQLGHYNLGIVNLNAGNVEVARNWFMKARAIDPSSPYGINAKQLLESEFNSEE